MRLKLQGKFQLFFGIISLLILLQVGVDLWDFKDVYMAAARFENAQAFASDVASMRANYYEMRGDLRLWTSLGTGNSWAPPLYQQFLSDSATWQERYRQALAVVPPEYQGDMVKIDRNFGKFQAIAQKSIAQMRAANQGAAQALQFADNGPADHVDQQTDGLTDASRSYLTAHAILLNAAIYRGRDIAVAMALALVLISIVIAYLLARLVARGVGSVSSAMGKVAGGDLTIKVKPNRFNEADELGEVTVAFNQMVGNLGDLVKHLSSTGAQVEKESNHLMQKAEEVTTVTRMVEQTVQQVASGATDQAKELSQVSETVDQFGQAVAQIAEGSQVQASNINRISSAVSEMAGRTWDVHHNASEVANSTSRSQEVAERGGKSVQETIRGMAAIRESVFASAARIEQLKERSEEIGNIVGLISEIADQTNLLALNAAIEAARAGEHGRGFAVVAQEVRELAERSRKATQEIGKIISEIQADMGSVVVAMQQSTKEADQGAGLAQRAGGALEEILQMVEQTNSQIKLITQAVEAISNQGSQLVQSMDAVAGITEENTASTQEMSANSGEMVRAIQSVAAIAEENSAATEEVSAAVQRVGDSASEVHEASQDLAKLAREVQGQVGRFRI